MDVRKKKRRNKGRGDEMNIRSEEQPLSTAM
jgi:hypothetical protein